MKTARQLVDALLEADPPRQESPIMAAKRAELAGLEAQWDAQDSKGGSGHAEQQRLAKKMEKLQAYIKRWGGLYATCESVGDVRIDAYLASASVAVLDMIEVPERHRRAGIGTEAYLQWEASLPASVEKVLLMACDAGDGRTDNFWEQMGFDYVHPYNGDDTDESNWEMVKHLKRSKAGRKRLARTRNAA